VQGASEGGGLRPGWGESDLYGGSNGRSTPREIIGVCSDDGAESSTVEVEDILVSRWYSWFWSLGIPP
jgi:hypothetical protein